MSDKIYLSGWKEMMSESGMPKIRYARYTLPDQRANGRTILSMPVASIWSKTKTGECRWYFVLNHNYLYQVMDYKISSKISKKMIEFKNEFKYFKNKKDCVGSIDSMLKNCEFLLLKNSLMPFLDI